MAKTPLPGRSQRAEATSSSVRFRAASERGVRAAPRETEEELTARVSADLKRALVVLAIVAAVGLALGYLLK